MIGKKQIDNPTEEMLETSIRNNIFFYYVTLFTWVGFFLYAIAYKDGWLMLDAVMIMIAVCYFGLAQKIDKQRLELLRK